MKKTNFRKSLLASSALLAIVALIALSTATFAWYTAQSSVSITQTNVASAGSASASLAIDVQNSDYATTNSSVDLLMTSSDASLKPMVPKVAPHVAAGETAVTTYADFSTGTNWNGAPINNAGEFLTLDTVAPATIQNVKKSGEGGDFPTEPAKLYLLNTALGDSNNILSGTVTVTIGQTTEAGTNADDLRVAVFLGGEYIGTWKGGSAEVRCGTVEQGQVTSTIGDVFGTDAHVVSSGTPGTFHFKLNAHTSKEIQIVAWFEGEGLTNLEAGEIANFSIVFSAS